MTLCTLIQPSKDLILHNVIFTLKTWKPSISSVTSTSCNNPNTLASSCPSWPAWQNLLQSLRSIVSSPAAVGLSPPCSHETHSWPSVYCNQKIFSAIPQVAVTAIWWASRTKLSYTVLTCTPILSQNPQLDLWYWCDNIIDIAVPKPSYGSCSFAWKVTTSLPLYPKNHGQQLRGNHGQQLR